MNIFVLSYSTRLAAKYHCDQHMKMCLEYAQILCTVAHLRGVKAKYRPTHQYGRIVAWANTSAANAAWLRDLLTDLGAENIKRFGKTHKSVAVGLDAFEKVYPHLPEVGMTKFALAMPDKYKHRNTVKAYRAFYKGDKTWARWNHSAKPYWIAND